uniref:Uncharacterized protein n=1 Tax=Anguilla anguilla TaxID=7936 RepID=A0A0E9U7R9_ANGAN
MRTPVIVLKIYMTVSTDESFFGTSQCTVLHTVYVCFDVN